MRAFRQHIKTLNKHTGITHNRHHRLAKSLGGSDDPENISIVPKYQHECFHAIFSNLTPQAIALVLNEKWLPKEYRLVCVPADATVVVVKK